MHASVVVRSRACCRSGYQQTMKSVFYIYELQYKYLLRFKTPIGARATRVQTTQLVRFKLTDSDTIVPVSLDLDTLGLTVMLHL